MGFNYIKKAGSVDVSVTLRVLDSTDGTPEAEFAYNTAGIDLWYRRTGGDVVDITEVTLAALTTAHTDGGVKYIHDGYFRLDLPDAACAVAAGVSGVVVGGTATGMVIDGASVSLVGYDPDVDFAQAAIVTNMLDHLVLTTIGAGKPTIGTLIDKMMNKDASQTFDPAVDSLEGAIDDSALITDLVDAVMAGVLSGFTVSGTVGEALNKLLTLAFTGALVNARTVTMADIDFTATQKAALSSITDVKDTVDTALTDIHLDHLFAADYNPASKPGVATALLNELVESDGGVSRLTANALETAPSGGAAPETIAAAVAAQADMAAMIATFVNGGRTDLLIDAIISELAKVPKSDSTVSWNSTAIAAIQTAINNRIIRGTLTDKVLLSAIVDLMTTPPAGA